MSASTLKYHSSLNEYAVPDHVYVKQHPEYDIICTGVLVFDKDKKLLLVQRSASEKYHPNVWEIPGGKVDDTDETILHGAARELKEEAGLEAVSVLRKVTQFTFVDEKPGLPTKTWLKLIFEVEVEKVDNVILDPVEHQDWVFASEEEVISGTVGDMKLVYFDERSKEIKLDAFKFHREAVSYLKPGSGWLTNAANEAGGCILSPARRSGEIWRLPLASSP